MPHCQTFLFLIVAIFLWPGSLFRSNGGTLPIVSSVRLSITETGAVADGGTLNTQAIQKAIDQLALTGGGTVVVPEGVFVSGALFMKSGVNLHLEKGGVLMCSTDMENFPPQRTRIEGHFEDSFTPGLINAEGCDGLRITGEGTLNGQGRPIWDLYWKLRNAEDKKNFHNLSVPRARLCVISNSRNVLIDGITFQDSQFWNLHLYNVRSAVVRNCRFTVPDDYRQAPSSDGIDIDSSQDVTVDRCFFSVTDDCIALKGSKGPFALEDDSPPVERIRINNCTFQRGHGAITLGSEATIVRDVTVTGCTVTGSMPLVRLKLRPDTPQTYENLTFRDITLDNSRGTLFEVKPWRQYADLKGQPAPRSFVRNIVVSKITGRTGSLGEIRGNRGQTTFGDILVADCDLQLRATKFPRADMKGLRFENVSVNGSHFTLE